MTNPLDHMDTPQKKFDAYAESYEQLHTRSVSASGEDAGYFHEYKIGCLRRLGLRDSDRVLDYGCGIGNLAVRLKRLAVDVHGYDPSGESLNVCRSRVPGMALYQRPEEIPEGYFDTAVMSGVLHHIPVSGRARALRDAVASLRPGGRLVVFEHNPGNPMTRKVVRDCPFDDDAILLAPKEVAGLLRDAGCTDIRTDYIVFFPKFLSWARWLEPRLRRCPFGAQTMTCGVRA